MTGIDYKAHCLSFIHDVQIWSRDKLGNARILEYWKRRMQRLDKPTKEDWNQLRFSLIRAGWKVNP